MLNIFVIILSILILWIIIVAILFKDEIKNTKEKDPAAVGFIQIILLYSGLHAVIVEIVGDKLYQLEVGVSRDRGKGDQLFEHFPRCESSRHYPPCRTRPAAGRSRWRSIH